MGQRECKSQRNSSASQSYRCDRETSAARLPEKDRNHGATCRHANMDAGKLMRAHL